MTITWQGIVTAGAVLSAITAFTVLFIKTVRWIDKRKELEKELAALKAKHERDNTGVQEELTILTYGILACLKGLKEQGCNGPVTEAINEIEKHMNKKAHE